MNQLVSTTLAVVFPPVASKYGYSSMFFFFAGFTGCTNPSSDTPPRIAPPLCVNETNFVVLLPPYFAHRMAEPLQRLRQDLTAVPCSVRHHIMTSTNHNRMPKVFMRMVYKLDYAIFQRTRHAEKIKDREVLYIFA